MVEKVGTSVACYSRQRAESPIAIRLRSGADFSARGKGEGPWLVFIYSIAIGLLSTLIWGWFIFGFRGPAQNELKSFLEYMLAIRAIKRVPDPC